MGAIVRILFPLIGYIATATVITLAMGFGYLWHTELLTDDKMFRVIALLQGVDLQQIAESRHASDEVPPEEPSRDAIAAQQQLLDRNFEVKLMALQRGRREFDHQLDQLLVKSERFDRLAPDWEDKLKQQTELTMQENLTKVVSDIEQVKPATAKDLLMRWIEEGRMDDAITVLGKMSENKKAKILKSFQTADELDKLHEIHRLLLESAAVKDKLNQASGELQAASSPGR